MRDRSRPCVPSKRHFLIRFTDFVNKKNAPRETLFHRAEQNVVKTPKIGVVPHVCLFFPEGRIRNKKQANVWDDPDLNDGFVFELLHFLDVQTKDTAIDLVIVLANLWNPHPAVSGSLGHLIYRTAELYLP